MNKLAYFIIPALFFLSGCATYSLQKGEKAPYNQGFIVTRYDRLLPEYTLGKDNAVPADEQTARERFRRRRVEVETYYKKMGYIENRFKQNFIDPPIFMLKAVLGIFWLPSIALNDYKYNHDPQYKESVDKQEDAAYKTEKQRIQAIKDQLNAYIQEDLKKESGAPAPLAQVSVEQKPQAPPVVTPKVEPPPTQPTSLPENEAKPVIARSEATTQSLKSEIASPPSGVRNDQSQKATQEVTTPTAVIIAKPTKGYSPLLVQFNAAKSFSPKSRIVSYAWDFGDGDTSTKKTPANTYWSATYGSRKFIVTLAVKDEKGSSASTSTEIEVIGK